MCNLEKISKAFSLSTKTKIYGREKELNFIREFLKSNKSVLHVTGKPGTGKTSCILQVLKGKKILYTNYFIDVSISKIIRNSKSKVIVIDEFDRYFEEKKRECISLMILIRKTGKKLITVSNNLIFNVKNYKEGGTICLLKFMPYTAKDFMSIVESKIKETVEIDISSYVDLSVLKFICSKFDKSGDLRAFFRYFNEIFTNIKEHPITLKTLMAYENSKKEEKSVGGIHHKIVKTALEEEKGKKKVYEEYLKECKRMKIEGFDKIDFNVMYDYFTSN